ncbi:MarR family winged helix-turn-helix transcriptional regulator [Williamsia sterculiae]|nr:MarR family transcriptional regulator [Williamsia sterculiae]
MSDESQRGELQCPDGTGDDDLAGAWHTLTVRYHRLQCEIDRVLQHKHQISASEFEVLERLSGVDQCKLRMSELSGQVHLSQSALSRLVAGLEKDGLAQRTMCDNDRRSVFAALTPDGAAKYVEARPTQRQILRTEVAAGGGLCGTAALADRGPARTAGEPVSTN